MVVTASTVVPPFWIRFRIAKGYRMKKIKEGAFMVIKMRVVRKACLGLSAVFLATFFSGCSENAGNASAPNSSSSEAKSLRGENERLRTEVAELKKQIEELSRTPQSMLSELERFLSAQDLAAASKLASSLGTRFPGSAESNLAKNKVEQLQQKIREREERAKLLEAKGIFGLKPTSSPSLNGITLKKETVALGKRWTFDAYDDSYHYREAERGERLLVLRATVQSTDKNPSLPEVAIYKVDGSRLTKVRHMDYEFRRWSGHGQYIGLYHDYANDFAHSKTIPFNLGVSISEELSRSPFAVVFTGQMCHRRDSKIGQPEVVYSYDYTGCKSKDELVADDFTTGPYRIIEFFNKPKGG